MPFQIKIQYMQVNEKNCSPFQFTVHTKKPNSIRALSATYSNYLKIRRKLQEQTTNNLVTACFKHSVGNQVFSYRSQASSTCRSHSSEDTFLASPRYTFPFLSLPCAITTEDVFLLGGGRGRKRKERVAFLH